VLFFFLLFRFPLLVYISLAPFHLTLPVLRFSRPSIPATVKLLLYT